MRLVTLTRDMRPWQRGDDAALPDDAAKRLIDAGDATVSKNEAASGLKPDSTTARPATPAPAAAAVPKGRYVTRQASAR
jgi:hypothetical protein